MADADGYPTDEELHKIQFWDPDDHQGLYDFVKSLWRWPETGCVLQPIADDYRISPRTDGAQHWVLCTGGWSGNEDIIAAMRSSLFNLMYWVSSHRGGRTVFEVKNVKD